MHLRTSVGRDFAKTIAVCFQFVKARKTKLSIFCSACTSMKSTTSKLCTILDVNVVAGSCLLGILGAVLAERHVLDMNQRLHMVTT